MTDLYRLLLRPIASRGRLATAAVAGGVIVLLAVALLVGDGSTADARTLIDNAGVSLLLPVVATVFATGVLGDHIDDGTLSYLWLLPVPRWRLALAAWAAATTVVVPLIVLPLGLAAALASAGTDYVGATVAASALGACGYTAVFTALGVALRRALLWGLVYAIVWEGTIASLSPALAALSIRRYARGVVGALSDTPAAVSGPTAVVVLLLITGLGLATATIVLRRRQLA